MSTPSNVFYAFLSTKLEAGGSETTISLDRVTTRTGETITTSDFGTFGRGVVTVNPDGDGVTSYPEYISFTAVSGTTLTGATRGLSSKSNSVVTDNKRFHPSGTPVVLSFGAHNIQDLIDYVDDSIATATFGTANAVTATAGEIISSAPAVVYLKSDGKWWLTDADTTTTIESVQLGVALSAVAAEASITNGVVRKGLVSGFSGLVAGTTYYVSNTAGGVSSSAGTNSKIVGIAKSSTELYFDPEYYELPTRNEKDAMAGGGVLGTPSTTNKFLTENIFTQTVEFTASGTWTKDTGLTYIEVEAWGAGGSGGMGAANNAAGGGGGGAYFRKKFLASELGATETVTIGAGGASVSSTSNGNVGGNTSFGSLLTVYGGGGGAANAGEERGGGGGGGVLSAGATGTNTEGGIGGSPAGGAGGVGGVTGTSGSSSGGFGGGGGGGFSTSPSGGVGGASGFGGGGGGGGAGYNGGGGGGSIYGGGGGGGGGDSASSGGGASLFGGNGGAGAFNANNATAGSQPGGGGGGSETGNSGAGGSGKVIVTEHYS